MSGVLSSPLAIAAIVVVLVVLVTAVLVARRRRAPRLAITPLAAANAARYRADFATVEADLVERPQQAAGRARGLVEEVLRRMGFPDRVDSAQKAKDVASYDREVSRLLAEADVAIRSGTDAAAVTHAVGLYGQALDRLLPVKELEDG